jgi:hypothetical protein
VGAWVGYPPRPNARAWGLQADSPRGHRKPRRNLDWGTGNPGAPRCQTQTLRNRHLDTFQRAAAPPAHRTSGTSWSQLCAHPAGRDRNLWINGHGALERLLTRLEKRMEALQRVKLDGFQMVISELEVEQDYLRRAKRYLEE